MDADLLGQPLGRARVRRRLRHVRFADGSVSQAGRQHRDSSADGRPAVPAGPSSSMLWTGRSAWPSRAGAPTRSAGPAPAACMCATSSPPRPGAWPSADVDGPTGGRPEHGTRGHHPPQWATVDDADPPDPDPAKESGSGHEPSPTRVSSGTEPDGTEPGGNRRAFLGLLAGGAAVAAGGAVAWRLLGQDPAPVEAAPDHHDRGPEAADHGEHAPAAADPRSAARERQRRHARRSCSARSRCPASASPRTSRRASPSPPSTAVPVTGPTPPCPAQLGNVVIAGHRTTYSKPFNRLNELQPGDLVTMTTADGRFDYQVRGIVIVPGEAVDIATQSLRPHGHAVRLPSPGIGPSAHRGQAPPARRRAAPRSTPTRPCPRSRPAPRPTTTRSPSAPATPSPTTGT